MQIAISDVQKMLDRAGFDRSTLAFAAASDGNIKVMERLLEEWGSGIFNCHPRGHSAYHFAAAGNSVDALRWLDANTLFPSIPELESREERDMGKMAYYNARGCYSRLAFTAAMSGSFEALEFIAGKIPEIRTANLVVPPLALEYSPLIKVALLSDKDRFGDAKYRMGDSAMSYFGLLATCVLEMERIGRDPAPSLVRMAQHARDGHIPLEGDIEQVMRRDDKRLAGLLLGYAGKFNIWLVLSDFRRYKDPIGMVSLVNEHLEATGKRYDDVCVEETVEEAAGESNFERFVRSADGRFHRFLAGVVRSISHSLKEKYRQGSVEDTAADVRLRCLQLLHPEFVGPVMLVHAVNADSPVLVKKLLDLGVDPNQYQIIGGQLVCGEGRLFKSGEDLPIHNAVDKPTIWKLLVEHGADINLPLLDSDRDLLYLILGQNKGDSSILDSLKLFSETGGDFCRTYSQGYNSDSAAELAERRGAKVFEAFLSLKAMSTVDKNLGGGSPDSTVRPFGRSSFSPL
jgi:hypothetical protein